MTQPRTPPGGPAPSTNVEKTVVGGTLTCPVCGAVNPFGEQWCVDCGFHLTENPAGPMPTSQETVGFAALRALPSRILLPLLEGENPVGRLSAVVPLANDLFASRHHAMIEVKPPDVWMEDYEAVNGTFVEGFRLPPRQKVRIYDGDRLRFAQSEFVVVAPEAGTRPAGVTPLGARAVVEVKIVDGPGAGKIFSLTAGQFVVGRQPDAGVLLSEDRYASARHCQISITPGQALLEDLGSRNGTLLNDQRLEPKQPVPLSPADRIQVGITVLEFRFLPPPSQAEVEPPSEKEQANE